MYCIYIFVCVCVCIYIYILYIYILHVIYNGWACGVVGLTTLTVLAGYVRQQQTE